MGEETQMKMLLGKLMLWQKLALFGVLAVVLVAPPFAMYALYAQREIATAEQEAAGMEPVRKLMRVIQFAQQHRGLSANVLGGKSDVEPQRAAKQTETGQAIEAFDGIVRAAGLIPSLRILRDPAARATAAPRPSEGRLVATACATRAPGVPWSTDAPPRSDGAAGSIQQSHSRPQGA